MILQSLTAQLQGAPFTQTAARMVWIPGYALLQLPRPGIPRSGHWYRDGMGERPHPTRTPTMLIRAPVVTSPRQLLNSAPRLCQTTLQSWLPATPGATETRTRPSAPVAGASWAPRVAPRTPHPRLLSVHLVRSGAPEAQWPQLGS